MFFYSEKQTGTIHKYAKQTVVQQGGQVCYPPNQTLC